MNYYEICDKLFSALEDVRWDTDQMTHDETADRLREFMRDRLEAAEAS